MFVVVFAVQSRKDHYLDLAKQLRPKLEVIDGFIDNERSGGMKPSAVLCRYRPGKTRRRSCVRYSLIAAMSRHSTGTFAR